jgi:GNAT superfamily N-acetyltransferase
MPELTCAPLAPDRLQDYLHFFDTRAFTDNPRWSGCYCYFPVHDPALTDWGKRTAGENRRAVAECIAAGATSGFLAYLDGEVVGWCHAGTWSMYPMLRDSPQPDAEKVGVVFCFVVAPEARGRGVATALLAAACDGLRTQGMTAVQARPARDAEGAAANHLGPLSMYLAAGFAIVRDDGDRHVIVRKALA